MLYFINDYDFWTSPNGLGATDIMAAPELIPQLVQLLTEKGIEFAIKFDDVEK